MSITDNKKKNYNYQIDSEYVYRKFIELEDRSRRSNIGMDRIAENKGGT